MDDPSKLGYLIPAALLGLIIGGVLLWDLVQNIKAVPPPQKKRQDKQPQKKRTRKREDERDDPPRGSAG